MVEASMAVDEKMKQQMRIRDKKVRYGYEA